MNCLTEMYSAIVAEVPVPTDHTTTTNMELLNALTESGRVSARIRSVFQFPSHLLIHAFESFSVAGVRPGAVSLRELHRAGHRGPLEEVRPQPR
mgnify:CR=1 FL=1